MVVARNARGHLATTIHSLLDQSLKPKRLIIIDDGSTDGSGAVVNDFVKRFPKLVTVVHLPDKGYDIRRVPSNINLAWRTAESSDLETDYFMISGDDCTYSTDYVSRLTSRMDRISRLVVVSGRASSGADFRQEHSPAGSGRIIRCSFWRETGEGYPIKAGWETWLLYKALQRGYEVKLFPDLTFDHLRPRGAKHQFLYWGAAMMALGYQPLYAMGRIAKNALTRRVTLRGSLNMLRGYLLASIGSDDPFISQFEPSLRHFVRRKQVERIRSLVRAAGRRVA